jgi:hypothetical protein
MASIAMTPTAPTRLSLGVRRGLPSTRAEAAISKPATPRHAPADGALAPDLPATSSASAPRSGSGQDDPRAQLTCRPAIASNETEAIRGARALTNTQPSLLTETSCLPARRIRADWAKRIPALRCLLRDPSPRRGGLDRVACGAVKLSSVCDHLAAPDDAFQTPPRR